MELLSDNGKSIRLLYDPRTDILNIGSLRVTCDILRALAEAPAGEMFDGQWFHLEKLESGAVKIDTMASTEFIQKIRDNAVRSGAIVMEEGEEKLVMRPVRKPVIAQPQSQQE